MNCPSCKQLLPEGQVSGACPHCGHDLPVTGQAPASEPPPFKINWLWFWIALIAPPVLTALSALLMRQGSGNASNEGLSPAIALIGGGLGGLVCGIVLGVKLGKTSPSRVVLSLVFSGIMVIVSIMFCFFGCSLGGYQFDMK
jgi:hypothetical protein